MYTNIAKDPSKKHMGKSHEHSQSSLESDTWEDFTHFNTFLNWSCFVNCSSSALSLHIYYKSYILTFTHPLQNQPLFWHCSPNRSVFCGLVTQNPDGQLWNHAELHRRKSCPQIRHGPTFFRIFKEQKGPEIPGNTRWNLQPFWINKLKILTFTKGRSAVPDY